MPEHIDEIATVLDALEANLDQLSTLTRGLDETRLRWSPDDDTWSASDILAHLRANADVWGKSLAAMITQDHPTLRYVSPRGWLRKSNYADLDFHPSFLLYAAQRNELLKSLKGLPVEDWSRGATFTATARGKAETVLSYAQRIASHEAIHLQQVEVVLLQGEYASSGGECSTRRRASSAFERTSCRRQSSPLHSPAA
jgi:hypothetical protein